MTKFTVTVDGVDYDVSQVQIKGATPVDVADLSPAARDRIARGIRNFLGAPGEDAVRPLPWRATMAAQGFAIDHDLGAVNEHIARRARGAGGEFDAAAFDVPPPIGLDGAIVWASPPCEHYAKRQKIELPTAPCNECGAEVPADQWSTHSCDPAARARHQEGK